MCTPQQCTALCSCSRLPLFPYTSRHHMQSSATQQWRECGCLAGAMPTTLQLTPLGSKDCHIVVVNLVDVRAL